MSSDRTALPTFPASEGEEEIPMISRNDLDRNREQDMPVPRDWPSNPTTLKDASSSTWWKLMSSSGWVLVPAPFIVLAVYLACLHRQPQSDFGNSLIEVANVAATLWPIAFAAVLGTALKSLALYSCEKGTTLGALEILLGSLTMGSTLYLISVVHLVTFWTPILVLAWVLSPLGGQSVLRAVALHADVNSTDFPIISYPSTNLSAGFDRLPVLFALPFSLRTVFGAAFSSSATRLILANASSPSFNESVDQVGGFDEALRLAQQDVWGNVRVPFLHMLEGYNSSDPHRWVDVSNSTIPPYESLIGIPIRGVPATKAGNATVMIQSSYIALSCQSWINGTAWLQKNISQLILAGPVAAKGNISVDFNDHSFFTALRGDRESSVASGYFVPPIQFDLLKDEHLNATSWRGGNFSLTEGQDRPSKQTLIFVTDSVSSFTQDFLWNMTMCSPSTSYVDAMVRCSRFSNFGFLSCFVERLRHTKGRFISANATVLSFPYNLPILPMIPRLTPDPEGGKNDLINLFLRDPARARPIGEFYKFERFSRPPSLEDVSMPIFEARLANVLNTVVRASFEQSIIVGADAVTPLSRMIADNATGQVITPLSSWGNSTGSWVEFTDREYKVNWVWMGLYGTSTLAMLVFAIGHIFLQYKICAPDILSSVSSLTRDSKHVSVPPGGSMLDGEKRVKLLKSKRVRIQDVRPGDDVGRIAFSDSTGGKGLDRQRQYS
ncbi:hypothetical protein F66182_8160 [Fusarium sp. NRRL 66182]|nr:hypothetical protein F66182_8160 [Fusarium sp. NRRL 66182]